MSGDVVELDGNGLKAAIRAIKRTSCGYEDMATAAIRAYLSTTDLITSQAAEIERLTKENTDLMAARNENAKLRGQRDAALARIKQMQDSNSRMAEGWSALVLRAETAERLLAEARAALTPSAETKADYIGEFQFTVTMMELDESDEPYECQRMVTVPWATIKEIMAAISARTLNNGGENGR